MSWKEPEGRVFVLMMFSLLFIIVVLVMILAALGLPVMGLTW